MSNPAGKLLELLQAWEMPKGTSPARVRGMNEGAEAFWRRHVRAVGYLEEIRRLLDGAEADGAKVEHFKRCLPRWTAAVFSFDTPWKDANANQTRPCLSTADAQMLEALDGFISEARLAPDMPPAQRDVLQATVRDSRQLVLEDAELPKDIRRYLLGLITEADACLAEYDALGSVGLRSISLELGGALLSAAASVTNEDRRKRFTELAGKILIPVANLGVTASTLLVQIGVF